MPSNTHPTAKDVLAGLPASFPELYTFSDVIRILEVAKKYDQPEGTPITHAPEYTQPGGPNSYICTEIKEGWIQGFFPGSLWLVAERERLLPRSLGDKAKVPVYTLDEVEKLARRWQGAFRHQSVSPAINHDQGFRFQPCYGRDYEFYKTEDARNALVEAADSLVDRYDPKMGCIRSWDFMIRSNKPVRDESNLDEHFLVIADNFMNLDLLYLATELTGDNKYAEIASTQAARMTQTHIRPDGTTYHVVDYGRDGSKPEGMTAQGYADESCWARGQAWVMYGMAQCALRTSRGDFIATTRRVSDVFLSKLPASGVPHWDFEAPLPCPYDASAGTVAARGLQMLYVLLRDSDPSAAEHYLAASFRLVRDILRECAAPPASLEADGVNWGEGAWEPILMHSTIDGNEHSAGAKLDHGLVYADYYLLEYANEAVKLQRDEQRRAAK